MAKLTLQVSDATPDEVARILGVLSPSEGGGIAADLAERASEGGPGKKGGGARVKKAPPATLPANAGHPAQAETTEAAPIPAAPAPAAPEAPDAAAAAPDGAPSMQDLMAKARKLGTGPFKQSALLAVMTAMGVPSMPKLDPATYADFDRLLDAAIAYSEVPGASLDTLKSYCEPGRYQKATSMIEAATAASMGL